RAGAAARPAGDSRQIPWIARRRANRSPGEFMSSGLTYENRARLAHPGRRRRVHEWEVDARRSAPGGGRHVRGKIVVLDADRNAVERPAPTSVLQFPLGLSRGIDRAVANRDEALEQPVSAANS